MNCIVAVIIAILALVIHLANIFFEEKTKICPKMCSRWLLIKWRHRSLKICGNDDKDGSHLMNTGQYFILAYFNRMFNCACICRIPLRKTQWNKLMWLLLNLYIFSRRIFHLWIWYWLLCRRAFSHINPKARWVAFHFHFHFHFKVKSGIQFTTVHQSEQRPNLQSTFRWFDQNYLWQSLLIFKNSSECRQYFPKNGIQKNPDSQSILLLNSVDILLVSNCVNSAKKSKAIWDTLETSLWIKLYSCDYKKYQS